MKTMTHIASLATISIASTLTPIYVAAQDVSTRQHMEANGYTEVSDGVWETTDDQGVVHRRGYGLPSLRFFADSLDARAIELSKSVSAESSMVELILVKNAIEMVKSSALEISVEIDNNGHKASGNNGCSAGGTVGSASATVTPVGSTATGTATRSMFGPPPPGVMLLTAAMVYKGGVMSFDADGIFGPPIGSSITASAFGASGAAQCYMFSYGQIAIIGNGCASWSDAMYAGTCS